MHRREFIKLSGFSMMALPILKLDWGAIPQVGMKESLLWTHGSPFIGHSDRQRNFRRLSPDQIKNEIIHFRTAEPWRKKKLFGV